MTPPPAYSPKASLRGKIGFIYNVGPMGRRQAGGDPTTYLLADGEPTGRPALGGRRQVVG